jgi:hypothetical protein
LALPPVKKRIIYLDQFVFSNMMKELDPANVGVVNTGSDGFYLTLFKTLDRLSKLQLIVCPDSPLHDHESVVDTRYEKIRAVFRQLSHDVSFRDPRTMLHAQIMRAFDCWMGGEPCLADSSWDFALTRNPHVWRDRYRIELNCILPGFAAALRTKNIVVTQRLREVCKEWREDPTFSFRETFENELAGHWRQILEQFARYTARFAAVHLGYAPFDDEVCFPPAALVLVTRMMTKLAPTFPNMDERIARIREFFISEHFRAVSGVRISALLWATIARDINAGRKSDRFPKASMYNDIDAVAQYSPFCDAMFVDKEISHFTRQRELQQELAGTALFFSLRKNEKADFIEYLRCIEADAPSEHIQMVEEVYGRDWPTPFVDLLADV